MTAIEFQNVTMIYRSFGKPERGFKRFLYPFFPYLRKTIALRDISFKIREGEVVGILGPNGAGKTTACKLISALVFPAEGNVFVFGMETKKFEKEVKQVVGIQSESIKLYHRLTVRENLEFFGKMHGIEKKELERRINYFIELFGLKEYENRLLDFLSTGNYIKVQIARALIHDPKIVILDEPFANIDLFIRERLKEFIREMKDKSLILTSHYINDIEELCKRIILISSGKLIGIYDKDEFIEKMKKKIGEVEVIVRTVEKPEGYLRKEGNYYIFKVKYRGLSKFLRDLLEKYEIEDIFIKRITLEDALKWFLKH